jgi:hypothetical protein
MNRNDALRKIRACLARAKGSTFPEEAARALAQAQALMARFDVEQPELLAAGVDEHWSRSRAAQRPPQYEVSLASLVARMFGCRLFFSRKRAGAGVAGGYSFVGAGSTAEIAAYSYAVLSRQLTKARAEYTATHLKRYRKNKVAAADEFCAGWVLAAGRNAPAAVLTDDRHKAIDAYMSLHHSSLGELTTTSRALANPERAEWHGMNGWIAGHGAHVHAGIGQAAGHLQIAGGGRP